ncbi:hypothetical protein B9Z65_8060 [Elsinoe australis]|uniref:Uncharacterized protein n=1 Tax=Elsinoe australis TaxID=40998 RepID=A0A2P7YVZ4_9PEZI|nr:hypothetical protein B9Z65_8060 [Elsinoe australis]
MASPYLHHDDSYWSAEWRVNGVWNAILTSYFPHSTNLEDWIVAPEAYPTYDETQSLAADLCVVGMEADHDNGTYHISTPVLTYEGKGVSSARTWPQIEQQILDWCLRGVQNGNPFGGAPFCCWAIGTKGKYVKFWAFNGAQLLPLGIGQNAVGHAEVKQRVDPVQDITTQQGWGYVSFMLNAVRGNPYLTAQEIAALPH